MHLVKYLAQAGVASRRKSEELIRRGSVEVDGRNVVEPGYEVGESSSVTVSGKPVTFEPREYYVVNKPLGVISTVNDTHARPIVTDLVPSKVRLYPVGRLDADTTGLILLTNDGDLANGLIHPRYEVPKTYRATLDGPVSEIEPALERLRTGIELEPGAVTAPAKVRLIKNSTNPEIQITIHEGRKRQVRLMCKAVGYPVRKLQRIRFGPLVLGKLAEGDCRALTSAELKKLRNASRKN